MQRAWMVPTGGTLLLSLLGTGADAQAPNTAAAPGLPVPPAPGGVPAAASGENALAIVLLVAVAVVAFAVMAKIIDRRRQRAEEAVALEAQIAEAFLRDRTLVGTAVTPHVSVPFWGDVPATIVLAGQVPNPAVRQMALRIADQTAAQVRAEYRIEDHLTAAPASGHKAA
jgi:hypothetical protein